MPKLALAVRLNRAWFEIVIVIVQHTTALGVVDVIVMVLVAIAFIVVGIIGTRPVFPRIFSAFKVVSKMYLTPL